MNDITSLFHFDSDRPSFEDMGKPNGTTHWDEEVLMGSLGYEHRASFRKAVMRAKQACLSAGLQCEAHFVLQDDGSHLFTRFGCYLVAMNGSPSKPQVAAAQAYFATLAETFQTHLELASTAKRHGVENYAFFQNKGYLGLYNMNLAKLCERKGIGPGAKLINHMGKTELAANLFRITQTDAKIKNENITGQNALENAALNVGRTVRNTMINTSGTRPEDLPPGEDINEVRKKIKGTSKALGTAKKKPKEKKSDY